MEQHKNVVERVVNEYISGLWSDVESIIQSEDYEIRIKKAEDLVLAESYVNDILRLAITSAKEEYASLETTKVIA